MGRGVKKKDCRLIYFCSILFVAIFIYILILLYFSQFLVYVSIIYGGLVLIGAFSPLFIPIKKTREFFNKYKKAILIILMKD